MDQDSLKFNPDISVSDTDEYIKVYGGKNYFLILSSGRLYGIGRNEYGQICRKTIPYVRNPELIATCAVSAAAGWHFSGFVNANGEVNIIHAGSIFVVPDVRNIRQLYVSSNTFFAVDCDSKIFRITAKENFFSYPRRVKFEVTPISAPMEAVLSGNQYHMCMPYDLKLDSISSLDLSDYKKIVKGKLHSFAAALKPDGKAEFIDPFFGVIGCNCVFSDITDIAMSESEDFLFSTKNNELLYVNAGLSTPFAGLNEAHAKDAAREKKLNVHIKKIILP